jgi:hypothetical protein
LRLAVALIVLSALPDNLWAQRAIVPPSIGLPLPPIGLPLPAISPMPTADGPAFDGISPAPRKPRRRPQPAIVFFGAPYDFGFEQWQQAPEPGMMVAPPATDPPLRPTGRLELLVEPADAQVFIGGEYFGTVFDLQGALDLPPGTHRLEILLAAHEPLVFDVRIEAGRRISYRGALSPLPQGPLPSAAPPPAHTTFYFIPGCYLGNVPPDQVKLPAGCDRSRMITYKP